jgi:hypothetical protein
LPPQIGARHHALADARWTRDAWKFLASLDPLAGERCCTGRKYPEGGTTKISAIAPG